MVRSIRSIYIYRLGISTERLRRYMSNGRNRTIGLTCAPPYRVVRRIYPNRCDNSHGFVKFTEYDCVHRRCVPFFCRGFVVTVSEAPCAFFCCCVRNCRSYLLLLLGFCALLVTCRTGIVYNNATPCKPDDFGATDPCSSTEIALP